MSEFDIRQAVPQKQDSTSSQSLKGEIADAGAEISQRARDALRASKDVARDKFKEASGAAAEVAEGASDHFRDKAQEQQRSGADIIDRLAGNIRQAAHAFENDAPFAARGINSSADYVEDAAEKFAMAPSEISLTEPPISQSGNRLPSSDCRCSPASQLCVSLELRKNIPRHPNRRMCDEHTIRFWDDLNPAQ